VVSAHPWSLVAPWYRWDRFPGVAPRATPPVIQKYETSKLVDMFRANPQRSLRFTGEDKVDKRRKLFLAQHKRFYLVVCELHCDRFGFPNARADDVCQAGFVLRRRRTPVPAELRADATRLVGRISKRRAQIEMLRDSIQAKAGGGESPGAIGIAQIRQHVKRQAHAQARLDSLRSELLDFTRTNKLRPVLEGWTPSELEGVGTWSRIEDDVPQAGEEQVFPLFPLIPDPKLDPHAARGRSLYYGLVPTASADTDSGGAPRLEPKAAYELRCFVRRHDPDCPRKPGGRDCHGELTWSAPTESFTLASPQDLVGTSNRPITVHLPDIPELLAQARKLPFGAGTPLKMLSPKRSALPVVTDEDGKVQKGAAGGAVVQVCSFAIPLITIVAYFVLQLFLPIVLLLFGLWPLLKLKFCIPPSIELDIDIDIAATLGDFKAGVAIDASVTGKIEAALAADPSKPPHKGMPRSGYGGEDFGQMATGDRALSLAELLEVSAAQVAPPTNPAFGPRPPLPDDTVPSPNSALAPLIWESELLIPPIPELEQAA
jgi:hypothetical protein